MSLFQLGDFTLHSGQRSSWKIECDALTPEDWAALAAMAVERFGLRFQEAHGVERGGVPFADALNLYARFGDDSLPCLVVDDVLTTGASLSERRRGHRAPHIALVAFARTTPPPDVLALWTLGGQEVGR